MLRLNYRRTELMQYLKSYISSKAYEYQRPMLTVHDVKMIIEALEEVEHGQEIMQEYDMLQGNVNRLFVTDDIEELNSMALYAHHHICNIWNHNRGRILKARAKEKVENAGNDSI